MSFSTKITPKYFPIDHFSYYLKMQNKSDQKKPIKSFFTRSKNLKSRPRWPGQDPGSRMERKYKGGRKNRAASRDSGRPSELHSAYYLHEIPNQVNGGVPLDENSKIPVVSEEHTQRIEPREIWIPWSVRPHCPSSRGPSDGNSPEKIWIRADGDLLSKNNVGGAHQPAKMHLRVSWKRKPFLD